MVYDEIPVDSVFHVSGKLAFFEISCIAINKNYNILGGSEFHCGYRALREILKEKLPVL